MVAVRLSLWSLARRIVLLNDAISVLSDQIEVLVRALNQALLDRLGIRVEVACQLLVTAGDNPDRMRSEDGFAMLCGVAPLPASSGQTKRHCLNLGGDRNANSALHLAVITRMRTDERTRNYVARRTSDGLSNLEIIRRLKRYLARELYPLLRTATRVAVSAAEAPTAA